MAPPFMILRAQCGPAPKGVFASCRGIEVQAAASMIELCRKRIEIGHDAATSLDVYRGDVLAIRVRPWGSIKARRRSQRGRTGSFRALQAYSSAPADTFLARDRNSNSHDVSNTLSERLKTDRFI